MSIHGLPFMSDSLISTMFSTISSLLVSVSISKCVGRLSVYLRTQLFSMSVSFSTEIFGFIPSVTIGTSFSTS